MLKRSSFTNLYCCDVTLFGVNLSSAFVCLAVDAVQLSLVMTDVRNVGQTLKIVVNKIGS